MRTVDTDSGHKQKTGVYIATNITMIGASLIASTFLVCYDN